MCEPKRGEALRAFKSQRHRYHTERNPNTSDVNIESRLQQTVFDIYLYNLCCSFISSLDLLEAGTLCSKMKKKKHLILAIEWSLVPSTDDCII